MKTILTTLSVGVITTVAAVAAAAANWSSIPQTTFWHTEGAATVAPDGGGVNRLFVLSGHTGSSYTDEVEMYDGTSWSTVTTIPGGGRQNFAAVTLPDGRIAVFGGMTLTTTILGDVPVYDPVNGTWGFLASMPTPIHHHKAVLATDPGGDAVVYIFGGSTDPNDPNNDRDVVEKYDITSNTWATTLPPAMPATNHAMGAALGCDGRIYLAGGRHTAPVFGLRVDAFDPTTETWDTTPADLNVPRRHFDMVSGKDRRLYVFFGDDNTLCGTETVESFDPSSPSVPWSFETPAAVPSQQSPATALGEYIYVFSGYLHGACGILSDRRSDRYGVLPGASSIGGYVFHDVDCDGDWDPLEPPLVAWTVILSGPVNLWTTTDGNGAFSFTGLVPGSYSVSQTIPSGWTSSTPPAGAYDLAIPECGVELENMLFGNCDCVGDAGVVPPKCLRAYFPLDEGSGGTANDVALGNDGTLQGTPTWNGTGFDGQGSSLDIDGPTDFVSAPAGSELDFGTGSFAVSARVRSTDDSWSNRSIACRRDGPYEEPTGFHFYARMQQIGIQLAAGTGGYINLEAHTLGGTDVFDGNWHHVMAVVCRSVANPSSNSVSLYVDGVLDAQWTGGDVQTGDITPPSSPPLRMGQESAGFDNATFSGSIDDVQLYGGCCLGQADVTDLAQGPLGLTKCTVPSVVTPWGQTVASSLTICNYTTSPQTYNWSLSGLPAGSCDVDGPSVFTPAAGSVTVPLLSCVSIPFSITVPNGLVWPLTGCYQAVVRNVDDGSCVQTEGVVQPYLWSCLDDGGGSLVSVSEGESWGVRFGVGNGSDQPQVLDYRIVPEGRDGDPDASALSLDGLPPGKPATGALALAPGDSTSITVVVQMSTLEPFRFYDLILEADLDGDGTRERLAAVPVRGTFDVIVSAGDMPVDTGFDSVGAPGVTASPNPFRAETTLRYVLPGVGPVNVLILDVAGRRVREFVAPGDRARWDGLDQSGRRIPPGVYFVRASREGETAVTRTVRLR